jgi:hypothetical protein
MNVDTTFLLNRILDEKAVQIAGRKKKREFQEAFPELLTQEFRITSTIESVDQRRREVIAALQKLERMSEEEREKMACFDEIYEDTETVAWWFYRQELDAFYNANTAKIDDLLEQYTAFAQHG